MSGPLPFAPVDEYLRAGCTVPEDYPGSREISQMLGRRGRANRYVQPRTIQRWRREGVSCADADWIANALGLHPRNLWRGEHGCPAWDDVPMCPRCDDYGEVDNGDDTASPCPRCRPDELQPELFPNETSHDARTAPVPI